VDDFRQTKISISHWVDDHWVETFKIETTAQQQMIRDVAAVCLGFGTERERHFESLLEGKNNG
jgi:hypothetical protein